MRFLFCSLASYGFVHPMLRLARALKKLGNEASIVTDVAFSALITRAGIQRIPRGDKDGSSFQLPYWADPLAVTIQVKHTLYAVEQFNPDVIVGQQLALGPMFAARAKGIPISIVGLFTYPYPHERTPTRISPELRRRLSWRREDMTRHLFRAAQELGCKITEEVAWELLVGDLFLTRSVPELDPNSDALPRHADFAGDLLWNDGGVDARTQAWLARAKEDGARVIYVQLGRFFRRRSSFGKLLSTLCGMPATRLAICTGRFDSDLGPLPDSCLVQEHIPQDQVLKHAAAVIPNGNSTVVLGALCRGVPGVIVPSGGEQLDVAERCESLGVAISLSPDEGIAATIAALNSILEDPAFGLAARRAQSALASFNGVARACDGLMGIAFH